jgi:large subunit ribosomal protein L6
VSRIGRMPIPLPEGVRVDIQGSQVAVTGPRGSLARQFHRDMEIVLEDDQLMVHRPTDERYRKQLEVQGVGYRVDLQGDGSLLLQLGFSHPVRIAPPEGIQFEVEARSKVITVNGIDKGLVGQVAAEIRAWRPPEPYKGKGIRYVGEYVRRKAGKAGKIG